MDRETLNEMVKLKFASRKAGGPEIDLVKLAADARYADGVFSAVESLPDESLVLLAMTLRDKFGLLAVRPVMPEETAEPVEAARSEAAAPTTERYMLGARS
ncbi:hypothetical protein [Acidovorax sp.]|uniref:hypothetical protein n=1 Tax=Acidovorax sp. TaxID=1872122 RepID=UPI000BC6D7E8|nr:hypothetical protein [Acidovorax sp.]OYW66321.1 MAG: hypothetical protein B7Z32_00565 [Hydrogenophilales bacterium 12-64-13]OYZ05883.1 MAG: hypothetical protein B7Y26_06055 [Hydrogenophilales bacterium 16-64-46]OZA39819.1 MAG: hypothetical protein B7X87_02080 [Hydrogenophilales bacterium 17-64-34]HQT00239.1 hypothetical protein [Thiobacillus sp.]